MGGIQSELDAVFVNASRVCGLCAAMHQATVYGACKSLSILSGMNCSEKATFMRHYFSFLPFHD